MNDRELEHGLPFNVKAVLRFTGNFIGLVGMILLIWGLLPWAWSVGIWLSHTVPWWIGLSFLLMFVGGFIEAAGKR